MQLSAAGYSGHGRGVLDSPCGPRSRGKFLGQVPGAVFGDASTHYPASGEVVPRFADVHASGIRRVRVTLPAEDRHVAIRWGHRSGPLRYRARGP